MTTEQVWEPMEIHDGALSPARCHELAQAAIASVADNALSGAFDGTRGFQRVFRRPGLWELTHEFPFLQSFIDLALDRSCNAFYFNALVVGSGQSVARHVDCSLKPWLGQLLSPRQVTVLYLQVPNDLVGGELQLFDGARCLASVRPRTGTLLRFAGALAHEVCAVAADQPRISLVLEQYRVDTRALNRIPAYSSDADGEQTRKVVLDKLAAFVQDLPPEELAELQAVLNGTRRDTAEPG